MNLIDLSVELIGDVQQLRRDYRSGKISLETYCHELNGIGQIEKLANVMIKTKITEERFKSPIVEDKKLKALESPENEKIKCSGCQKKIKRSVCLDWSGESPTKYEECQGCENFASTRKLLLPEKSNSGEIK